MNAADVPSSTSIYVSSDNFHHRIIDCPPKHRWGDIMTVHQIDHGHIEFTKIIFIMDDIAQTDFGGYVIDHFHPDGRPKLQMLVIRPKNPPGKSQCQNNQG